MVADVFDIARKIALNLPGGKTVTVRFPSDDEWAEYWRKNPVVQKNLGRGASESSFPGQLSASAWLLGKIADGVHDLDEYEAQRVVSELAHCIVSDVRRDALKIVVALDVPGGQVEITLTEPTLKDASKASAATRFVDLPYGRQEYRTNLAAVGSVFDGLLSSQVGYTGGKIPVIHKQRALHAAIELVEQSIGVAEEVDFTRGSGPSAPPSAS